jgi:glycosyltransferase involved in cell wall biosynthesis
LRKKIYLPLFEKPLLRRASLVHLLGQSEQQGLENILPGKKQNLVPYGFEATHNANESHEVDKDFFTIAFCGRIDVFTKGLDALLEGFALLKKQHAHARLWIIGDGPEMPALKQMAESLHLGDAVTFWGAQYGGEKMALLRRADVFAHPSRNEGLPTAVLEAAAEGIACLVTTATNMGAYVSQYGAGIEIETTTGEQVAKGLGSLHEAWAQGTLQVYGSNARTMVQKAFTWKEILNRFELMYKSIV